jgi:hypothetical protein
LTIPEVTPHPTLTSLPFSFWIIPGLDCCLSEDYELEVAEEVHAGCDEEDYSPLEGIRLRKI